MMMRPPDAEGFDLREGRFFAQPRESCGKGKAKPQPRLDFPVAGVPGTRQLFIVESRHHAASPMTAARRPER